ncbi:GNAT family N-acetyltransferase [Zooshikella harenae]|uniref:GNAT family N-acetyltransferase n=1 Tax=Zooshikella harenae TaxID=2827238 RepID=A0ABS5Z9Q8_9GAMM|nr:GNAT family N-acetyltransferase [Zooshikella harenae]MBU2710784.1 GNAT family N-acetyltransferase [Zooshikella harenae]
MNITYKINEIVDVEQFINLLNNTTLGERRPVNDYNCIQGMLKNSNLIISAWVQDQLVGIARSVTDFNYACYLSDLAIDEKYQRFGMGKQLITLTQAQLGPRCKITLLAAPAAREYYKHIGFTQNEYCWTLDRHQTVTSLANK